MKRFKAEKWKTTVWHDARKSAAFDECGSGENVVNVEYLYCGQKAEKDDLLSRKAARFDSSELVQKPGASLTLWHWSMPY